MHDSGATPFTVGSVMGYPIVNFSLGFGNSFRSFMISPGAPSVGLPSNATIVWVGSLYDARTIIDILCLFKFLPAHGSNVAPVLCSRDFIAEWDIDVMPSTPGYVTPLQQYNSPIKIASNQRVVFAIKHTSATGTVQLWLNGVPLGTPTHAPYSTEGISLSWVGSSDPGFNYAACALHEFLAFGEVDDLTLARFMGYEAGKFGYPRVTTKSPSPSHVHASASQSRT